VTAATSSSTTEVSSAVERGSGARGRRRRRALLLGVAVLLLVAAALVIAGVDPFRGTSRSEGLAADNSAPTSLATVRRGPLSSQINQSGTLGYAAQRDGSPYTLINQATGVFSALPSVGQTIKPGQVLYRVNDQPVVLLDGQTPAYRALSQGMTGPDVRELNANLVTLGYATSAELDRTSDYFGSATAYALERLQDKLGVDQTGSLALGRAVFLPGPLRITKVTATLGTAAGSAMPVAQATSTRPQVVVNLDATQQTSVKLGQRALVTLPDHQTTPGVVRSIGTVASSSATGTTIPLYIVLNDPRVTGGVDQAPVQVQITTAGVRNALIVPVTALLSLAGGGYAVELVDARGMHHLLAVTPGLFDDADGLVQVSGSGLAPGQRVVVPAA
jgi:peptidoglycan hydrolase-like protein with peptidoglycan-binding domain